MASALRRMAIASAPGVTTATASGGTHTKLRCQRRIAATDRSDTSLTSTHGTSVVIGAVRVKVACGPTTRTGASVRRTTSRAMLCSIDVALTRRAAVPTTRSESG